MDDWLSRWWMKDKMKFKNNLCKRPMTYVLSIKLRKGKFVSLHLLYNDLVPPIGSGPISGVTFTFIFFNTLFLLYS